MNIVTKAFFKKCSLENRKKFNKSGCILPISIGQKIHEGVKFEATLNLINRSFKECSILLDDTIQRFTMKIETPDKELEYLKLKALFEGDLWLERNKKAYENLTIPFHIIRWDDFFKSDKYKEKRDKINNDYIQDLDYQESFDFTIKEFLRRYERKNLQCISFNYKKAYELCLEYLKEECACMCLWAEKGYEFEVYPSGRNKAMEKTYEKYISPFSQNILISVSLYFKKSKKQKAKN